jgi:hypothetical protein
MKTKYLLNSVAVIAALAVSAPAWAQRAGGNETGGNSMGIAGPNPGGPNTPGTVNSGSFGGAPSPQPASTSAMPPKHHHAGHVTHAAAHHKMAPLTGSTANQLNQEELARLQAGSSMPPPAAPMPSSQMRPQTQPPTQGGNSMGMPGPNMGGPGLTPYSSAPPR